jgi:hypothetical protein
VILSTFDGSHGRWYLGRKRREPAVKAGHSAASSPTAPMGFEMRALPGIDKPLTAASNEAK